MSPLQIVRRARARLAAVVIIDALLHAFAGGAGVIAIAAGINELIALPWLARVLLLPVALMAATAAAGIVLWRGRAVRSVQRVALWIEERQPQLRFALVTAIDPEIAPADRYPALHAQAAAIDTAEIIRTAWRKPILRAAAAAALSALALVILQPGDLLNAATAELMRNAPPGPPAPPGNRLEHMIARVRAPAYARAKEVTIENPISVSALVGSRIEFGGEGIPEGVTAVVDSLALNASESRRGWSVAITMGEAPVVMTFQDRLYRRLVVLEPQADSVPAVRLRLPANDTTYQTVPRGKLTFEAEATDDIGIDYGFFEYMLSTGSAENFETRTSKGRRFDLHNARSGTLREIIDLDTMRLAPGTVLHIRAVAFDYNDVTGPGKGVSDTRTLRIAEPVDSTSINPTPPLPIDSMWMSQRRLNMKTDTLIRSMPKIDRQELVHTSSGYGNAQEDIRQRAMAVIAILEDDAVGGTFQTEVSLKLREAVELMYEARVLLAIAKPDSAMPYMVRVLAILDEIRLANRYYLRGLLRPMAVNVERVRHTGEDPAADEPRKPRPELTDARARLADRIADAAALVSSRRPEAIDSLTYIRVTALREAPDAAPALGAALELLRRGIAADTALARARRALEPPPARIRGPVEWRGVGQ